MKILQINAVYNYGSTGRTTAEMHKSLIQKKINSYIACPKINDEINNSYSIGTFLDHKIHGLKSRIFGKQGYYSKRATAELIKYIINISPDIVHLRNLHSNYINLPVLLKFLADNDIATVITLHDCWFFTGKCMHYTLDNCYKWQTGCHNCHRIHNDNKSYFFDRTSQMWNDKKYLFDAIPRLAVVGVSDWITNEAHKSFLKNAKIIKRIYNWIDYDLFKPATEIVPKDKFIILCVASGWNIKKGLDQVIKLAKRIDDDITIIMVGNINEHIALPNNIKHIVQTDSVEELVKYYSMADVFFQPSLEETFGKVTAEALSCGTPVICYNSTANPELVKSGCGFLLEKGDIDGVLDAINTIKQIGKDKYSETCRNFAISNFSKDDRINDHIQLYKELMNMKV